MNSLKITEKILYGDFNSAALGYYVVERDAPSPTEKEIVEEVPFSNGVIDFSEALGGMYFDTRKIKYKLFLPQEEYDNRKLVEQETKKRVVTNGISPLIDTHDVGYYWVGKCTEISFEDDEEHQTLTAEITFECQPYAIRNPEAQYDEWDIFNFDSDVSQFYKYKIKEAGIIKLVNVGHKTDVTCECSENMMLTIGENIITLKKGVNKDCFTLSNGINVIEISGNGVIGFKFDVGVMI